MKTSNNITTIHDLKLIWKKWPQDKQDPPASEEDIVKTEARLHVILPAVLKQLFRIQDGGRIQNEEYLLPNNDFLKLEDFETLKEIGDGSDFPGPEQDWNIRLKHTEKLIVVAQQGFSQFLCLDYHAKGGDAEPEVVLLDTVDAPFEIDRWATFDEFVARLVENPPKQ